MQNAVSNKIRLILNELAILNQPEVSDGKFIYNLDTVQRLKSLATELYFLTDMQSENITLVVPLESPALDTAPDEVEVAADSTTEWKQVQPESETEEIPVPEVSEIVNSETKEELEAPVDPVQITPIKEKEPETIAPAAPNIESSNKFEGKISLTRKFEYINGLFAGDATAFASFLSEISVCSDLDSGMDVFGREYDARNWRKRSETADDLKQLIRKVI